ncbi:putative membrane protein YeaQ/YmgE (transglycosylase-associated protein family) [Nitrobacter vulgaris]|uniref:GlsB/YeaQ/YmgE family stress response membrane protein n=1 Tax=Nitrobacter vulgaris TaxID=29421 RepID=UPI002866A845|nr:putative membrane protein YeaQ/YmgE (transglycosylase-associated protein family) [Nitrobacter vulgaris]
MSIFWTITVGLFVGVIAKCAILGDNEPSGFIVTTVLGIVGSFVASYLEQALGWYKTSEGAGFIGSVGTTADIRLRCCEAASGLT